MKQKYLVYFICILSLWFADLSAQVSFTNKTRTYKSNFPTRSVMPGASTDINGDLVDDIIILDRGNTLKTLISSGQSFELTPKDNIRTTSLREWTLTAGDLDNDGSLEFITAGEFNQGSIVELQRGAPQKKSFFTNIYAQGSNTVDINNDGWLDYFVCDDDGPNKIYLNDKTGNIKETQVINFMLNDNTDGSGNYGSEWVDINGDHLPDLILSKCRAGVEDPKDMRRINRVYINNGNGTFTESGAALNLNSGAQSWVTVIGDYDNDGDQDALVVNHYSAHELMENIDNNRFVPKSFPSEFSSFSFQAVTVDFDNDGWLDILLAGVEGAILLHNKGQMNFEIIRNIIGPAQVRSFSVGDYNDDGFTDIFAHLGDPINEVGQVDDQVWLNNGSKNHYLKISLVGSTSNRAAIGAHLSLYSNKNRQVRIVKGGESYGIFNSLTQTFGIGDATKADSLIIRWPSGIVDKYYNLDHNTTYRAQEGKCMTKQIDIVEDPVIYKNKPVLVNAPNGYKSYTWSNGLTTQNVELNIGLYHISMTNTEGCLTVSKPIPVNSGCFPANIDLIEEKDEIMVCHGQSYEILAKRASIYLWQDGSELPSFNVTETGWVTLKAIDYCKQVVQDSVYVRINPAISIQTQSDTIARNKSAVLVSNDTDTQWYHESDLSNPIFKGDTLITQPLDSTTTFWAKITKLIDSTNNPLGLKTFPTANLYHTNTASGSLFFEVNQHIILNSFKVNTDQSGLRRIIIKNTLNDEIVFEKDINCVEGLNSILLNASLAPGNYTIGTDESINLQNLGYRSPRFVRTSGNVSYPYTVTGVCSILSSTFGASVYLYFYDWEVSSDLVYCDSETQKVIAFVEKQNNIESLLDTEILIYPNPTNDIININTTLGFEYGYISDVRGHKLSELNSNTTQINMTSLNSGIYILTMFINGSSFCFKIVKQ